MGGLHHPLYLGGKLLKEVKREPIILWGATGQAKVLYEFINKTYQIVQNEPRIPPGNRRWHPLGQLRL